LFDRQPVAQTLGWGFLRRPAWQHPHVRFERDVILGILRPKGEESQKSEMLHLLFDKYWAESEVELPKAGSS